MGDRGFKENYRRVIILAVISIFFKENYYPNITFFMDPLLSKYLCVFRKGFTAQHCTLRYLKSAVDKV